MLKIWIYEIIKIFQSIYEFTINNYIYQQSDGLIQQYYNSEKKTNCLILKLVWSKLATSDSYQIFYFIRSYYKKHIIK